MGVVYSFSSDKYIDLDRDEAVYIDATGDWISNDNTEALLEAFEEKYLSKDEMIDLGFSEDMLEIKT